MVVSEKITIDVYSSHFSLKCNKYGFLENGYNAGEFVKNSLLEKAWDGRYRVWRVVNKYRRYDIKKEKLYLPINILDKFKEDLGGWCYSKGQIGSIETIKHRRSKSDTIDIEIKDIFEDHDDQIEPIAFLSSNKRMKALSLQTGCIDEDSLIDVIMESGNKDRVKISTLYMLFRDCLPYGDEEVLSYSLNNNNEIMENKIIDVVYSGKQDVYEVRLDIPNADATIRVTKKHEVLTQDGYTPVGMLTKDSLIRYVHDDVLGWYKVASIEHIGKKDTFDLIMAFPYNNFVLNKYIVHNSGKTYCAIRAITNIKKRTVIFVSGLLDQWKKEFLDKTNLTEDDIAIIAGSGSLLKLYRKRKEHLPKIIIFSTGTMSKYIERGSKDYKKLPKPKQLFKELGIGLKVIDEVHKLFRANLMIDLHLDVPHNIYLSATYQRTSKDGNRIFNLVFPAKVIFTGGAYKKYVTITSYAYDLEIPNPDRIMTDQGYNQYRLEKILMKQKKLLKSYLQETVIRPLDEKYIKIKRDTGDEKALIIVGTVKLGYYLKKYLNKEYKHYKIGTYFNDDSEEALRSNDIIISTTGSAGEGTDIYGLRTVVLTTSFSAMSLMLQVLGRLRDKVEDTQFCFSYNERLSAQCRHYKKRKQLYSTLGKTYSEK